MRYFWPVFSVTLEALICVLTESRQWSQCKFRPRSCKKSCLKLPIQGEMLPLGSPLIARHGQYPEMVRQNRLATGTKICVSSWNIFPETSQNSWQGTAKRFLKEISWNCESVCEKSVQVFKCSSIFFMVCWSEYYGLFPHINMTSTWQMSQLGRHEWDRPRRGFGAGILEPNEPLNDGVSHGAPNTRRFGETVVFPSIPWIYFRKSSCFHLGCSFKKGTSHKVAFYREQKLMLCTARAKQKCEGSECQGCSMIPHWFSVLSSMQKPKSPIDFCRVNSPSQIPVDSRT